MRIWLSGVTRSQWNQPGDPMPSVFSMRQAYCEAIAMLFWWWPFLCHSFGQCICVLGVEGIGDAAKHLIAWCWLVWTDASGHSLFAVWANKLASPSGCDPTVVMLLGCSRCNLSRRKARHRFMLSNIFNIPRWRCVMVLFADEWFWELMLLCWPSDGAYAYFIRVQREYNLASKTLGTPTMRMIFRNILPYLTSVIVTDVSRALPSFISYETFLSFLGVGLSANVPSLGKLISKYTANMSNYPYLFWIPVAVLALVSVSLYIVGQTLADAADPRTHM